MFDPRASKTYVMYAHVYMSRHWAAAFQWDAGRLSSSYLYWMPYDVSNIWNMEVWMCVCMCACSCMFARHKITNSKIGLLRAHQFQWILFPFLFAYIHFVYAFLPLNSSKLLKYASNVKNLKWYTLWFVECIHNKGVWIIETWFKHYLILHYYIISLPALSFSFGTRNYLCIGRYHFSHIKL